MLQLPSLSGRVVGCEPAVLPCVLQDVAPVIGPGGSLDAIGEMWLRQLAKEGVEERTNTPDRRPKEPSRVHVHAALLTQRASPLRAPTSVSPGPEGPLAVSLWQRSLFFSVLDALSRLRLDRAQRRQGAPHRRRPGASPAVLPPLLAPARCGVPRPARACPFGRRGRVARKRNSKAERGAYSYTPSSAPSAWYG